MSIMDIIDARFLLDKVDEMITDELIIVKTLYSKTRLSERMDLLDEVKANAQNPRSAYLIVLLETYTDLYRYYDSSYGRFDYLVRVISPHLTDEAKMHLRQATNGISEIAKMNLSKKWDKMLQDCINAKPVSGLKTKAALRNESND